jgi:hypothetical protein
MEEKDHSPSPVGYLLLFPDHAGMRFVKLVVQFIDF